MGLWKNAPLRAGDVQFYRVSEDLSEGLIYLMVLFSPWAFGATEPWAIWTMNIAGYFLGLLLAAKLAIRQIKGYRPPRWDDDSRDMAGGTERRRRPTASELTTLLAILTAAILAFCLVSALNAGSTYHRAGLSFTYHKHLAWLPHSLDSGATWFACWMYLGLAAFFWALRDWLPGKSDGELRAERRAGEGRDVGGGSHFPARLRRLLWVLAINGGLLGLEGIAQRLEGSGKLLFLIKPHVNPEAVTQFGPYAYRSNASQYFNLLWPVCIGFWWTLHRSSGFARKNHHILLLCAAIMAACPIISTSRGGAIVTLGIIALSAVFLPASQYMMAARRLKDAGARRLTLTALALFFVAALSLGFSLGWKSLKPRLGQMSEGYEGREETYAIARPMAADYPIFGIGPGAFESLFQLYRADPDVYWPAQLHNDWLETRITFGWLGSGLIAAAFTAVALRWFRRGGIHGGRRFTVLLWLSLAGCLVHARFDFPFQIYSILQLFLALCALLSCLSRRP